MDLERVTFTLKCPIGGEEWPISSFKSSADGTKSKQTLSTVHFFCPANHSFNLKQFTGDGMLTKQEANKVLLGAEKLAGEYKGVEQ